jgi:hypothetical protein
MKLVKRRRKAFEEMIRSSCLTRDEICIDLLAQHLVHQLEHPEEPPKSVIVSYRNTSGELITHTWPSIPAFVRAELRTRPPDDLGVPKFLTIDVK